MRCVQCATEFEGNFCPTCGHAAGAAAGDAPLPELCGRCATPFSGRFCPNCGWPAGEPFPRQPGETVGRTLLGIAWAGGVILYLIYLAFLLGAFLYVSPAIWEGILAGQCSRCLAVLFLVNPLSEQFFVLIAVFGGTSFFAYFLLQLGFLIGLFVLLILRDGRKTVEDLQRPLEDISPKVHSASGFILVGQIFMALLFVLTLYFIVILPALGIETEGPSPGEPWYFAYSLVDAAIWEEVAFRLLFIGLPMAVGSLILRIVRASATPSLEAPSAPGHVLRSLKYLVGGQVNARSSRTVQLFGALLVLLSALLFGYAHLISWGAEWKFVDTFLGGLALGYLFLRRGIVASILLHFSINASLVLLQVLGGVGSPPVYLLGLVEWAFVVLGLGFTAFYLRELGRFLLGRGVPRRRRVGVPRLAVSQPPQTRDPGLYPVSCPQCGAQEAIYADGTLTCAQCGHQL